MKKPPYHQSKPSPLKTLTVATCMFMMPTVAQSADQQILNVSYDIARELYAAVNIDFKKHWQAKSGKTIEIKQSHAGSSKQARAIMGGLPADIVTFNQVLDVQILADKGAWVAKDWKAKLPHNASPYYSLPSILVRGDNPKNINNWDDLIRDDVDVIFPNPKTSGNGRYTILSAYGYAKAKYGSEDKALEFVAKLISRVKVFDTGGRGATNTFVKRKIGDALVTFEAEHFAIRKKEGKTAFKTITPSVSILADFPVAVVEKNAVKKGTLEVSTAYLEYLYSEDAQRLIATFGNRIHHDKVKAEVANQYPQVKLLNISDFGGWVTAKNKFFADGGVYDKATKLARKLKKK